MEEKNKTAEDEENEETRKCISSVLRPQKWPKT